ncbi:hypothetical protein HPB51_005632 [Rhipicephalus microplus]|uniref:Uncharacterized protein n=1 Tax=Rhipicephalus microplus TaxID=6941 RepID=A0A9J6EMR3_RHIMP|nr:hypothetical protein HPB51_005632 [Rhipicephalus microplus]
MLMHSSKFKALTFLPLRQVWILGGDKPMKSGFSLAPFYCFYTDLNVESDPNLLGALKGVRNCFSNDEVVGLIQCASAESSLSSIFQLAILRPAHKLLTNTSDESAPFTAVHTVTHGCVVLAYEEADDRWHRVAMLPEPRHHHAGAIIGDNVYVVGMGGHWYSLPRFLEDLVVVSTPHEHIALILYIAEGLRLGEDTYPVFF